MGVLATPAYSGGLTSGNHLSITPEMLSFNATGFINYERSFPNTTHLPPGEQFILRDFSNFQTYSNFHYKNATEGSIIASHNQPLFLFPWFGRTDRLSGFLWAAQPNSDRKRNYDSDDPKLPKARMVENIGTLTLLQVAAALAAMWYCRTVIVRDNSTLVLAQALRSVSEDYYYDISSIPKSKEVVKILGDVKVRYGTVWKGGLPRVDIRREGQVEARFPAGEYD